MTWRACAKPSKYKLTPTAQQGRELARAVWRRRARCGAVASTVWRRREHGVAPSRALHHGFGAAYHGLPAPWHHPLALPARSGVEGPSCGDAGVCRPPPPRRARRAGAPRHDLASLLPAGQGRAPPPHSRAFTGATAPTPAHLQGVWQRRAAGQWLPGLVEDWAYRRPLVPSTGRRTQDRHDR